MKLIINGNINKYYVQTLCMLFFPGAKFSEKEESDDITVIMNVTEDENKVCADAHISVDSIEEDGYGEAEIVTDRTRAAKLATGRALFMAGEAIIGYTPPWGILTGVRPAKVANRILADGNGVLKARRILRDEYFLNPKKAALVTSVAQTEMRLTKKLEDNLCSVYISIPFCPSRCAYCSFVSYTSKRLLSLIDEYLVRLKKELEYTVSLIKELGMKIATVYIGGGTPTVLDSIQLEGLLSFIAEKIDVSSLMEYTMEAGRPDTIDEDKLAIAREYGVTRISVNPQSLSDKVLSGIGRQHTALDFYRAYDIAANSGIKHINTDIIAGLPGDSFATFSKTVDRIISLKPDNITVHTFCVKKASDILRQNSDVYSADGGDVAKCVDYSQVRMRNSAYKPYYMYRQKNTVGNLENVGYSTEGSEGMYNIFMMEELHSIFAVGAGAVTKFVAPHTPDTDPGHIERIFMPKYPYEYLRKPEDGGVSSEEFYKNLREKALAFFGAVQTEKKD
jgi:oxygen-independent coproporphyrinogen-3 oxidase